MSFIGFNSKKLYQEAIKKDNLRKEQNDLIDLINKLQLEDKYEEANQVHIKINMLAEQIDNLKEYNEYIIKTKIIEIPYKENYTKDYLLKEINNRI